MSDRSPAELLAGSGLGSWWPWYLTETEGGDLYASGRYVRHTRYGILLYHPHSTILDLVVELGLPGLLFLLFLALALWTALRRAMRSGENKMLAAGIVVSLASIAFDLFLVRRPTRDGVWWLFVFGLLALVAKGIPGSKEGARMRPAITVGIPFFNSAATLLESIRSVTRSRSRIGNCSW